MGEAERKGLPSVVPGTTKCPLKHHHRVSSSESSSHLLVTSLRLERADKQISDFTRV